ncbi:MAG TPA: protein-methionine-sulfoxide reductase catalytic subunit MsrP [Candidatus Acidoferrales bacterium]|nr:protein-methionine-sulfoxide reductase catalytic subunit MsrP [Candidatus Acidoferrales bacterium]
MLIKRKTDLTYADVTPKALYMGRRNFLLGLLATGAAVEAWKRLPGLVSAGTGSVPVKLNGLTKWPGSTTEAETPIEKVTTYNNFYEFGVDKDEPSRNARDFQTSPWSVSVEGEVAKPRKFSMDEIMKLAPLEERIYRHRCVEAWSIVVPWIGYSFSTIVKLVEPTAKAKYVAFESYYDPKQMPLGAEAGIQLPYLEGLRLDEAMNPLTLLCVGMYGETLPNQDGAPVRMVIPWKYGFKSAKSLVKIRFVRNQPPTTWNLYDAGAEYGFYANVNPNVDHPRWSQASERRLGPGLGLFTRKIPTLMFNGYGDQVASLYAGMDLRKNF